MPNTALADTNGAVESRMSKYLSDLESVQLEVVQISEQIQATADILLGPEHGLEVAEVGAVKTELKGKLGELGDSIHNLVKQTDDLRHQANRLNELR